jgi:uncharacterized protein YbjQ (UPF0145 family)
MLPPNRQQENYVNFNAKIYIMVDPQLITTSNQLEGYRITKHLGMVRGITVRSRSIFGNIGAGLQTLVGGKISIYVELCERAREEAYQALIQNANERGANAIINIRYDANEVMAGVTEVLCYGTAVQVVNV